MQITIEDVQYNLPASLMDITLQQRIDFDKQYGKEQRAKLKVIRETEDPLTREMDFTEYHLDVACKTIAFFGSIPLETVLHTAIDEVLAIYHMVMHPMTEEVDFNQPSFTLNLEFKWKDATWLLQTPDLKNNSKMTFGEFIDSKQIVHDLYEKEDQKWEALLSLACIFFRKKGENYCEELSIMEEPRCQLLKTLPLAYALHIGFFLSASQRSYKITSRYSGHQKPKRVEEFESI